MEEHNIDYDALVSTTKIEDITSNEYHQYLLRQIKHNNRGCTHLCLSQDGDEYEYLPDNLQDLGWLGYFIGKSTTLEHLTIEEINLFDTSGAMELFCTEVNRNQSITNITIFGLNPVQTNIFFKTMKSFFQGNNNLTGINFVASELDALACQQISLAIGGRNSKLSLTSFSIDDCVIEDRSLVDIILGLSIHPRLKTLDLTGLTNSEGQGMGKKSCLALESLLHWTTTDICSLHLTGNSFGDEEMKFVSKGLNNCKSLHSLYLSSNDFGDIGADCLASALKNSTMLKRLYMTGNSNRTISVEGCAALTTLLDVPTFEEFHLANNNIGDDGAQLFAHALEGNTSLKELSISTSTHFTPTSPITDTGWEAFSRLLCDTSSINNTYLSNHSLSYLSSRSAALPTTVKDCLKLNECSDKENVAMKKMLQYHDEFDMQPLLKWDLKALPLVMDWFERAAKECPEFESKISKLRLSSLFDCIRGMPMLSIHGRTVNELREIYFEETALYKRYKGKYPDDEFSALIVQLQQRKDRAEKRFCIKTNWNTFTNQFVFE